MPKDQGAHPHVPPFERSVSVGATPDFFDSDIDQLIAELTIPPPPSSEEDIGQVDHLAHTWSGPENKESNEEFNLEAFEVDLEALVIPPPPGEASVSLDQIPIVPPVTSDSDEHDKKNDHSGGHQRSNSVDTFLSKIQKNEHNIDVPKKDEILKTGVECQLVASEIKPSDSNKSKCQTKPEKATSTTSSKDPHDNDSPGSVSEKLNTLLQMIPNLGPKSDNENDFKWRRTSSLRLSKPSPMYDKDKGHLPNGLVKSDKSLKASSASSPNQVVKSSQEVKQSKGEVTVSSKYSRHLRRTNSFDVPSKEQDTKEEPEKAVTENFSSLKAKLQSYRDYLLSKSNNSKKERQTEDKKEDNSPLRRSNSFTMNYLRRRNSSSDSDDQKTTNDTATNRSRRRDKESSQEKADDKEDKKKPPVWNHLAAPRSFRPHTSTTTQVLHNS